MVMATAMALGSKQRHELGSCRYHDLQHWSIAVTQEERRRDSTIAEIVKSLTSSCNLHGRDNRCRRHDLWSHSREHEVSGSRRPFPVRRPCRNGPPLLNRDRVNDHNFSGQWHR
ncbi:hypothetical protein TIFTF001_010975 [Ficus carica]|uniref:Uncharacterized protein n=1 Tax=Ficus carica TaxID=3494 RepID=A0AA88AKQ5_FICCA|nr:hypothetical protein TIFTF001_010975 [Ficus carica]